MKKYKDIVIIAILLLGAYFIYQNKVKSDKFDSKISSVENYYKIKLDSTYSALAVLSDSIKKYKAITNSLEKSEQKAKDKANNWKKSYSKLVKLTPKNLRDSLENYKLREKALLSENKHLRQALKKADSALYIKTKTITSLELKVKTQQSVIDTQEEFRLKTVEIYKKEVKKTRRQNVFLKIGGVLLVIGAVLL